MAKRQSFLPGYGYIVAEDDKESFLPGYGYVKEDQASAVAIIAARIIQLRYSPVTSLKTDRRTRLHQAQQMQPRLR